MNKTEWAEMIAKEIKDGDLYGSSFTDGVALCRIIKRAGYCGDIAEQFLDYCEMYHGEAMQALKNCGVDPYNAPAWAELLDLSELDEIARDLGGENDEDEEEEDEEDDEEGGE